MPIRFGGMSESKAKDKLKYIRKMDRLKNKKIKENPNDVKYFLRINYKEDIIKENIEKIIRKVLGDSLSD